MRDNAKSLWAWRFFKVMDQNGNLNLRSWRIGTGGHGSYSNVVREILIWNCLTSTCTDLHGTVADFCTVAVVDVPSFPFGFFVCVYVFLVCTLCY